MSPGFEALLAASADVVLIDCDQARVQERRNLPALGFRHGGRIKIQRKGPKW